MTPAGIDLSQMSILPFLGIEDPVSSAIHLLGATCASVLAVPLIRTAPRSSTARKCLGVFAFTVVFLLSTSGVYHWLPRGSASRDLLQQLDHAGIFMLIAGTFTAGHGLFFHGHWRWRMIGLLWTVGITGVIAKLFFFDVISESTGLLLYLAMGWLGAASMFKLMLDRKRRVAGYLFLGGVIYTLGAVGDHVGGGALALLPGVVGAHELFHMAVLGGIATHWALFFSRTRPEQESVQRPARPEAAQRTSGKWGESVAGRRVP